MTNVAITMMRDEVEIVSDFSSHILSFFDKWICVDHKSCDGTYEFVKQLSVNDGRVDIVKYTSEGYFQSEIMTYIVRNHVDCISAKWIFIIDADEFLPFKCKGEFDKALESHKANSIIRMHWHNLVPTEYSSGRVQGRHFLFPGQPANHSKIAFQPSLLPLTDFFVAQGNHDLLVKSEGGALEAISTFPLYHVPVRTFDQLKIKLANGVAAYRAMNAVGDTLLGFHWRSIAELVQKRGLDVNIANFVSATYGTFEFGESPSAPKRDLIEQGYREGPLDVAFARRSKLPTDTKQATSEVIELAAQPNGGIYLVGETKSKIFKLDNNTIEKSNQKVFERLPQTYSATFSDKPKDILLEFLYPSYAPIKHLMPTAWGGHIPFMFSLIFAQQPRRFVELGSHCGASFFAACQAIVSSKINCEAVAVDLWTGDHQTGFYNEKVFENFRWILEENFKEFGSFRRSEFDEAVGQFEDASIDLLHIDGLHTYEAVQNDFARWKPKLTSSGTILLHDTNVYRDDFGVHLLWDEVRNEAESLNFLHTHGLGILAYGGVKNNPIARVISEIKKREVHHLIEAHYERIGKLSVMEALTAIESKAQRNEADSEKGLTDRWLVAWQEWFRKFSRN